MRHTAAFLLAIALLAAGCLPVYGQKASKGSLRDSQLVVTNEQDLAALESFAGATNTLHAAVTNEALYRAQADASQWQALYAATNAAVTLAQSSNAALRVYLDTRHTNLLDHFTQLVLAETSARSTNVTTWADFILSDARARIYASTSSVPAQIASATGSLWSATSAGLAASTSSVPAQIASATSALWSATAAATGALWSASATSLSAGFSTNRAYALYETTNVWWLPTENTLTRYAPSFQSRWHIVVPVALSNEGAQVQAATNFWSSDAPYPFTMGAYSGLQWNNPMEFVHPAAPFSETVIGMWIYEHEEGPGSATNLTLTTSIGTGEIHAYYGPYGMVTNASAYPMTTNAPMSSAWSNALYRIRDERFTRANTTYDFVSFNNGTGSWNSSEQFLGQEIRARRGWFPLDATAWRDSWVSNYLDIAAAAASNSAAAAATAATNALGQTVADTYAPLDSPAFTGTPTVNGTSVCACVWQDCEFNSAANTTGGAYGGRFIQQAANTTNMYFVFPHPAYQDSVVIRLWAFGTDAQAATNTVYLSGRTGANGEIDASGTATATNICNGSLAANYAYRVDLLFARAPEPRYGLPLCLVYTWRNTTNTTGLVQWMRGQWRKATAEDLATMTLLQ